MTPARRSLRLAALIVLLLPLAAGCGFIFAKAPPSDHQQRVYFSCTESNAAPILDVIGAGLGVLSAVVIAADKEAYEDATGGTAGGVIAIYLVWAGVLAGSASVGFKKTEKCRAAKLDLAVRQNKQPAARPDTAAGSVPLPPLKRR
jgi:hypothetical protein